MAKKTLVPTLTALGFTAAGQGIYRLAVRRGLGYATVTVVLTATGYAISYGFRDKDTASPVSGNTPASLCSDLRKEGVPNA